MAAHQCTRFSNYQMILHEQAIQLIVKYLMETENCGIVYNPDTTKDIECYFDVDFSEGWNHIDADNSENAISCTGYVIIYAGCPVFWCSKLRTEIALSTT